MLDFQTNKNSNDSEVSAPASDYKNQLDELQKMLQEFAYVTPAIPGEMFVQFPVSSSMRMMMSHHQISEYARNHMREELSRIGYTTDEIAQVCAGKPVERFKTANGK